jgi:hypothetical protein
MKISVNMQLILIIICTFGITFVTSLLLELPIFKNLIRQILVIVLMLIELCLGFLIFKSKVSK